MFQTLKKIKLLIQMKMIVSLYEVVQREIKMKQTIFANSITLKKCSLAVRTTGY